MPTVLIQIMTLTTPDAAVAEYLETVSAAGHAKQGQQGPGDPRSARPDARVQPSEANPPKGGAGTWVVCQG